MKPEQLIVVSENELLNIKLIQSLRSLVPDYEHPEELENLETKTQPELIELLIAAGKYWREQAEG